MSVGFFEREFWFSELRFSVMQWLCVRQRTLPAVQFWTEQNPEIRKVLVRIYDIAYQADDDIGRNDKYRAYQVKCGKKNQHN